MSSKPLVSVIVPVFNGERFLGQCLSSVFAQDYERFEVVVVDDGSTDGTAGVAGSFPQVRYIYQANRGTSAARNTGVAAAVGELISFIDHDDLMMPNKLSLQVGHLMANPGLDCVLGRQELIFEPGIDPPSWLHRDRIYGDLDGVQPVSAVVRRSVLTGAGGFDPECSFGEDLDWLFRLRSAGASIAVLPEVVMKRRFHGNNQTIEKRAETIWFLKVVRSRVHHNRALIDQGKSG